MKQPTISIIIPVYNAEKTLKPALYSVMNQTYTHLEIICINDYSTDRSLKILCELAAEDDRLIIINNPQNMGVGLTRNEGLKKATGTYIGFLDSDDTIEPTMYELLCKEAIRGDFDMVKCDTFQHTGNKVTQPVYAPETLAGKDLLRNKMLALAIYQFKEDNLPAGLCMGLIWNRLYKREFLEHHNISFLSDREFPGEDFIFNIKVYMRTHHISLVSQPLYHYNNHPDSLSHGNYYYKQYKRYLCTMQLVKEELSADPHLPQHMYERTDYWICDSLQIGILNEWKRHPQGKKAGLKEIGNILLHPVSKEAVWNIQLKKLTPLFSKRTFTYAFYLLFILIKVVYAPQRWLRSAGISL